MKLKSYLLFCTVIQVKKVGKVEWDSLNTILFSKTSL